MVRYSAGVVLEPVIPHHMRKNEPVSNLFHREYYITS